MRKIIIHGDGGGDEMQVLATLLADPAIEIAGVIGAFGNTDAVQACQNMGDILALLGHAHIPFYMGATHPLNGSPLEGDHAHGDNGLGGTKLRPTHWLPGNETGYEFMRDMLRDHKANSITLIATGPLTDFAELQKREPKILAKAKQILTMGSCTKILTAHDIPCRKGNITPYAEFNWYMDAHAADIMMNSGLPIVLFPMNCTQQLEFTKERKHQLNQMIQTFSSEDAELIIRMMEASAKLDRMKFNADPFMHDVHTALALRMPHLYRYQRGHIDVVTKGGKKGRCIFKRSRSGKILVAKKLRSPEKAFDLFLNSLKTVLNKKYNLQPIVGPTL